MQTPTRITFRFLGLLTVVMVSYSSCRKAPGGPPPENPSMVLTQGLPGPKAPLVVRQARAVVYKLARTTRMPKQANINFAQGNFSIVLKPGDFSLSEVTCDQDQCSATLIEPILINATIPTGLHTKIKVQYRNARKSNEVLFSHYAMLGGQWTLLKVGEILSLNIEAGIAFESSPTTNYRPVFKDVYCSKTLSCETPLFVVNGTLDKNGLQFDSRLVATGQEGDFVKIVSDLVSKNQKIPFEQIQNSQWLENLRSSPPPPCVPKKSYDALWGLDDRDGQKK